jgi:uncharacterized oxidoreductase
MLISVERLTELAKAIVSHGGGSEAAAETVANHLVEANLAGHDSHGVGMLPAYMNGVKNEQLIPDASAELVQDTGPFMLVDGNQGFGQVVAKQAMEMAIERAKEQHIAVLSLRNCFHIGRIGAWGTMAAEAGFISIHYVNALSPNSIVAPYGGSDSRFTTNPYCTAIPATDDHPMLLLDMATSNIAHGKARVAYLKGVDVPENSLIDHEGKPTNDPSVIFNQPLGALRSAGLHKGYGLALICDILSGGLSGGGTYQPKRIVPDRIINNMLAILIDPNVFGTGDEFFQEVDDYTNWVKASPPAPGFDEVMFPGDPERKSITDRKANGIPVDDGSWGALLETAEAVGISKDEILRIVGN